MTISKSFYFSRPDSEPLFPKRSGVLRTDLAISRNHEIGLEMRVAIKLHSDNRQRSLDTRAGGY